MAHHPFPARLRIPTQNVGTGGIRGGQQTDRVASFHSFERRGHPRLFCSEESESLPHGTSRRQGQKHLARRSPGKALSPTGSASPPSILLTKALWSWSAISADSTPSGRSKAPCPTVGPTPRYAVPDGYRTPSPPRKQDALPSSSHLLYPFGSGTAGTSAPSFRPRLFCSVRLPMRFPATTNSADRPRTPTGLLRLSARGTVPDGSTAKVSESAGAPLQTAARPRQPKRSATRWTR